SVPSCDPAGTDKESGRRAEYSGIVPRYFHRCKHFLKNPVFFPLSFPFAAFPASFSRAFAPRSCHFPFLIMSF
ncbi:MAG: hypothetical protein Q3X57_01380, partial [Oscillospiraceae bacterium]|nr:hypothetical protein [Oscillospiraceae bacterium]